LNFHSTLAIFPVYQLGVERCSKSFFISDKWFQDFVTFLTFNVAVTIGNLIPKLIRKPGPKFIPIPVILRALVVFVFFALCNYKPTKRNLIPVLITNDYAYWAMSALSPLLFGYFTSLMMMYTPK
jgi:equilibrative nucleoside transporter 1/2/3